MKHIVLILITLLSLLCFGGCGEENYDPLQSLEGTRWKLVGIVDAETGTLQVLEPKDCDECYTLVWSVDDKVTAHVMNRQTLMLDMLNLTPGYLYEVNRNPEYHSIYGEYHDNCMFFLEYLVGTESYTKTVNELKLYYLDTNKNSYMLYKPFLINAL